jgi:hypothetical protein
VVEAKVAQVDSRTTLAEAKAVLVGARMTLGCSIIVLGRPRTILENEKKGGNMLKSTVFYQNG